MERKDVKIEVQAYKEVLYEPVKDSDNLECELQVLKDLYTIHSPSSHEFNLAKYIYRILAKNNIPVQVGKEGELYNIVPGAPLVCAHMDQVQRTPTDFIVQRYNYMYGMLGHEQAGLGADDKNGVWIVLNLILKYKGEISYLFSTMEEVGGMTHGFMQGLGTDVTDSIPYALIFDRKGSGDIIGTRNEYCMKDLEDDIAKCGIEFGYKPAVGVWSDCDHISEFVPCVNLSCGYYEAHTDMEYTNVNELINALDFGVKILATLGKKVYNRVVKRPIDNKWSVSELGKWRAGKLAEDKKVGKVYGLWDWPAEEDEVEEVAVNIIQESVEGHPFLQDDAYVLDNYYEFDVLLADDGFYLNVPEGLIHLTDMPSLRLGEELEVVITDSFVIRVSRDSLGYDAYVHSPAHNVFEEITFRDVRTAY